MAALEKVQAQITKLQAQADALIKSQSSSVIAKIRDLMEKHGLTVADIEAHVGGKKHGRKPGATTVARPTASAKYRDPKTGATWTGHGRAPAWIAAAKDRTKFLVDGSAAQPIVAAEKAAKGDNYVRGPQAPKYRDPRTGSTWSGRGPAPAWLAGAKDRSKFLIAGADEGAATTSKPAPVKKATKKTAPPKAAATKVSAKNGRAVTSAPSAKKVVTRKAAVKKPVAKKAVAKEATSSPAPVQGIEATLADS
ncbi:DNA-binding protein H-NS [Burkholderia sp. YR290]|jgi:DNA-binding protein H-NS|uniref:H-NS family nucleoid-associated regulatory protein n=1 Tax=Paraburkholderia hospita TaxID=169430 RepID=UPI0009A72A97|nr:H-NS family nucleoid-associated regulatory protein [Paraburkholderia hospita]SKD00134.1 DNA-binding protein H-NS [Paraburkholderia hospita]SOE84408.1 DNA-binding protein H-NS [Burkholderia sp. YR290]